MSASASTPSVWLHGAGLAGWTWDGIATGLAPDLPGHGKSAPAPQATVEAFADALTPVLPTRFGLVGHSLGGMVALELAARYPARVAALVLVEMVATVRARWLHLVGSQVARCVALAIGPAGLARVAWIGEQPASAEIVRTALAGLSRRSLDDALRAAIRYDGRPRLAHVAAPTLVIVGHENTRTHAQSRAIAACINGAEYTVLPGGHLLPFDAPSAFRGRVVSFLQAHP